MVKLARGNPSLLRAHCAVVQHTEILHFDCAGFFCPEGPPPTPFFDKRSDFVDYPMGGELTPTPLFMTEGQKNIIPLYF